MPEAKLIGEESSSIDEPTTLPSAGPLIRRKLEPPALSSRLVARPRVDALIETLLERHPVVCIYATPGAGKTTAAVQAVGHLGRPVAWLSVDDTDSAPGRLLTYLEAALGRAVPSVTGVVAPALAAGLSHSEVAGLLAETIGTTPLVLVLDELERVADSPEALAVARSASQAPRRAGQTSSRAA